jgi:hypothetical protein
MKPAATRGSRISYIGPGCQGRVVSGGGPQARQRRLVSPITPSRKFLGAGGCRGTIRFWSVAELQGPEGHEVGLPAGSGPGPPAQHLRSTADRGQPSFVVAIPPACYAVLVWGAHLAGALPERRCAAPPPTVWLYSGGGVPPGLGQYTRARSQLPVSRGLTLRGPPALPPLAPPRTPATTPPTWLCPIRPPPTAHPLGCAWTDSSVCCSGPCTGRTDLGSGNVRAHLLKVRAAEMCLPTASGK